MATTLTSRQFIPEWTSATAGGVLFNDGSYYVRNTPTYTGYTGVSGFTSVTFTETNGGINAEFPPNTVKITIGLWRVQIASTGQPGAGIIQLRVGTGRDPATIMISNNYVHTVASGSVCQTLPSSLNGAAAQFNLIPTGQNSTADIKWSGFIELTKSYVNTGIGYTKWTINSSISASTGTAKVSQCAGSVKIDNSLGHLSSVQLLSSSGNFTNGEYSVQLA